MRFQRWLYIMPLRWIRRSAFHFHDFQEQLRYSLRQDRLMALLCGFFAPLAVLLATGRCMPSWPAQSLNAPTRSESVWHSAPAPGTIQRMMLGEAAGSSLLESEPGDCSSRLRREVQGRCSSSFGPRMSRPALPRW
jgi:hypothetical protein